VTNDRAFYESKAIEKGLALALTEEIKAAGADVQVLSNIGDLYKQIAPDAPERDTKEIGEKLAQELRSSIDAILIGHGFVDAKLSRQSIALKQTGSPTRQFGTFDLTFAVSNAVEDIARLEPTLTLEGSFSFDVPSGDIQNVTLDRQTVAWTAPDGKEVRATTHHLRIGLGTNSSASTAIGFL